MGLQVAPAGSAPLPLTVTGPLKLRRTAIPALKLTSAGSDLWQEGQDALTLVRLSGVPDELVPSLGVKDSRGDWLFTWADLNANGGEVKILTSPDWSGEANLQLLISQLQNDGSLQAQPSQAWPWMWKPSPIAPSCRSTQQPSVRMRPWPCQASGASRDHRSRRIRNPQLRTPWTAKRCSDSAEP